MKHAFVLGLSIFISILNVPAHAFSRPVPVPMPDRNAVSVPCAELNQLMQEKFIPDFHADFKKKPFECPSPMSAVAKMLYDTYAPSQLPGAPDFYGFAKARTRSMRYKESETAVASANSDTRRVTVYGNVIQRSGEEYSASTLYHEARHMDHDDPAHVTCTRGLYEGDEASCDRIFLGDRIELGSGYHYDVKYVHWVLTAETRYDKLDHEILKSQLREMLLNRFNTITRDHLKLWLVP